MPLEDDERFAGIFQPMRQRLQGVESVRRQVELRIGQAAMKPSRRLAWSMAASFLILVAGGFLWWGLRGAPPDRDGPRIVRSNVQPDMTLEIDGTQMIEQIADIVDQRAVVVIWSYRGNGAAMPSGSAELRDGRYRVRTLRAAKLSDGRIFVCSLFIPDPGVLPSLEPPSIHAGSDDRSVIGCSVCPRPASTAELAEAIRSAGVDGKPQIGVDEIVHEIDRARIAPPGE